MISALFFVVLVAFWGTVVWLPILLLAKWQFPDFFKNGVAAFISGILRLKTNTDNIIDPTT